MNCDNKLKILKNFPKSIAILLKLYYNLTEVERSGRKCHKNDRRWNIGVYR